ncbi:unnamed protein product, partial [Mesorhabditis belari]|uniref:Uncharacterized protein n=1 Tax=Mesorhabditis belari TaxID=2138241 RepID=A0AAF3EM05_9BILA
MTQAKATWQETPPRNLQKISAALTNENVKWEDIKEYVESEQEISIAPFVLKRIALGECASNRHVCSLTVNSSKHFSFVGINILGQVLETLSTFYRPSDDLLEDEESAISFIVLEFCGGLKHSTSVLFIDSVLTAFTISQALLAEISRVSFVRCSHIENDEAEIADELFIAHTEELELIDCADAFIYFVTKHSPQNLKRFVVRNENNVDRAFGKKILVGIQSFCDEKVDMEIFLPSDAETARAMVTDYASTEKQIDVNRLEQEIKDAEAAEMAAREWLRSEQRDELFDEEDNDLEDQPRSSQRAVPSVSSLESIPWSEMPCPVAITINGASFLSISVVGVNVPNTKTNDAEGDCNGFVKLRRPSSREFKTDDEMEEDESYYEDDV